MLQKNHKLFIAVCLACIWMAIGLGGCKKCYNCKSLLQSFNFIKGSDTIRWVGEHAKEINDTVSYYVAGGYTVDSSGNGVWIDDLYFGGGVCGKAPYKDASEKGDACTEIK